MVLLEPDRAFLSTYRSRLEESRPGAVLRMLVYGSKARGEARKDSDLDVLLIVADAQAEMKEALRRIGYALDPYGDRQVSILAYTESEWRERLEKGLPFQRNVAREGLAVA